MKKVEFTLKDYDNCLSALAYICNDKVLRAEYSNLLLDIKVGYPTKDIEQISRMILSYSNTKNFLDNVEILKKLKQIHEGMWIKLSQMQGLESTRLAYEYVMEIIKGNADEKNYDELIFNADSKDAFLDYVGGDLKALINSDNEDYAHWNGKAWIKLTSEEANIIYGDFVSVCRTELVEKHGFIDNEEYQRLLKKISTWDNRNRVNEALGKLRRDRNRIINLKHHNKRKEIICSQNGKLINLATGEIRESKRDDYILNTSQYNLVDKEQSEKFMEEYIFSIYKDVLGEERLNFILDLFAYKLLGKGMQKAIFLIGKGRTGKSTFKNIAIKLFEDNLSKIPFTYLSIKHKGSEDVSRDDLLVSLNDKSIGWCSEGDSSDVFNQARFKNILSNSSEKARKTRGRLEDVNLEGLDLMIDTNEIPKFTNYSDAINRRLLFVNFENPIPLEKTNSNFKFDVLDPNFDYIFTYFIYRAIELVKNGVEKLEPPKCIQEDTTLNIKELDSITKFTVEYIAPLDGNFVEIYEAIRKYKKMCEDENLIDVTDGIAEQNIGSFLFKKISLCPGYENIKKDRRGKSKKPVFYGVAFIEDENPWEGDNLDN